LALGLGSVTVASDPHDLYGLELERFVSARGDLAKALRQEGHREQAQAVGSLRKPSVAAWAVNQLVRTQRSEINALFSAGDALQIAQSQLLSGAGNGATLRAAVARERDAVSQLLDAARGLLSSDGHELGPAMLDRVSDTLHAAALDEDARAQVKDGRLERELRHVGLGATAPAPKAAPRRKADADNRAETKRREAERAEQGKAAEKAAAEARRAAQRADRECKTAHERRDEAAASLQRAENDLATARDRAEQAATEHQRADEALTRLRHDS
jgi:hypothetical protein